MKNLSIAAFSLSLVVLGSPLRAGEPVTPPTPPKPTPPPTINPPVTPNPNPVPTKPATTAAPSITVTPKPPANPGEEMLMLLTAMRDGDAAKRDAAAKVLVTKGAMAYRSMNQFLNAPNAELVKCAKDVKTQIEQRGMQLFQEANAIQGKALTGELTIPKLEEVRKAWIGVATYVGQPELRQNASQAVQSIQTLMGQLEDSNKTIVKKEADLKATPPPGPVARAAIYLELSQAYTNIRRFDDALKAAQNAFESGGRDCRLAPAALKLQAEMLAQKGDFDSVEKVCKKLIAEYGEALETRSAYASLTDVFIEHKKWDDAVDNVKKFIAACPLEDEAQEAADKLVDAMMDKERDYLRAFGFSTWIKQRLPKSRVRPEILKNIACCSEYIVKDLPQADTAYRALVTEYADLVTAKEMEAVLKRVKAKIDGTFPKEPKIGDDGPAGALAQFLAAVRTRDAKKLGASVLEAEAIETAGKLTCEECELIRSVSFADFIIKKTTIDGDKANFEIDYYDAASDTAKSITQKATQEKGAWKIQWTEPDEQLAPPKPLGPKPPVSGQPTK
ncbi:MAG: hypothetical protein WCT04_02915 [Planctomycetota bacterium]